MTLDMQIQPGMRPPDEARALKIQRRHARRLKVFDPDLVRLAPLRSFAMLDPRNMMRNPVMFLVEIGTVLTAIVTVQSIAGHAALGLIVYQAALTALNGKGLEASQVLHVGSRVQQDLVPARRLGMRTALFAGDRASLQATPEQLKEPAGRPDVLLTDLSQLTEVVG